MKRVNNKYRTKKIGVFLLGIVLAGFLMNHHFKDIYFNKLQRR